MKVVLNRDACIGCGACAALCEDIFEIDNEGLSKVKKEKGEKYGVHCCHYLFCFVILCGKSSIIFAKRKGFAIILSYIPTFCRFKRHLHYYSDVSSSQTQMS